MIFAFVVSLGASFLLYRLLADKLTANAKAPTTQAVVATHSIAVGALIGELDVKLADWGGTLPPQACRTKEEVVGRGVVANIYEGEPVLNDRLAAKGAGAGLAATIPIGMRAVAVRVNEIVGVAGFVLPGMRVDLLIAGTPPGGNPREGTLQRTLLQNIEVLSVGQRIEKSPDGKPEPVNVVNLLVTPEQAEILSLASNETRIQLVLRNPLDTKEAKTPGTAMARLFGAAAPTPVAAKPAGRPMQSKPAPVPVVAVAAPPAPPPPPLVVEVIHGAQRATVQFKSTDKKEDKEKQQP